MSKLVYSNVNTPYDQLQGSGSNNVMELEGESQSEHYVAEFIKGKGYSAEIHDSIRTEDGYLLTLYRIPYGRSGQCCDCRPVVVLMHGIASNSFDFVVAGPKKALGFLLSDLGYDVWMMNCRGSGVSRKHTHHNADIDQQYWRFSFHEMAIYDLPAIFDYIERTTGYHSIAYIGHSLGTLPPLVLLAEKPEYNDRFNLLIEIAPVAVLDNMASIPYKILNGTKSLWMPAVERNINMEFLPKWVKKCVSFLNKRYTGTYSALIWAINALGGTSTQELVSGVIASLMQHYPDTTSVIVWKHVFQIYDTGAFRRFDYGPKRNLEEYGTTKPPPYDMKNVVCPVVMFTSSEDTVATPKDVRTQSRQVHNCIAVHELENPTFNHSDFLYGKNAHKAMYPYIFDHLKKYALAK